MEAIMKTFYSDTSTLFFSAVRGRHYLIARGNTVIREIFLDKDSPNPFFPFTPLIPFFEHVYRFPFTWKSVMTEQKAERLGIKPILTFNRNAQSTDEGADRVTTQKMCLVVRYVPDQHYLLDREVHAFEITILSSDHSAVKFVFKYTLKIEDMNTVVADFPAGNFLEYAESAIILELTCALQTRPLDELRGLTDQGILDEIKRAIKKLNTKKYFGKHRFRLLQILHEAVIILPKTQELIDAQQQVLIEAQKVLVEEQKKYQALKRSEAEAQNITLKGKAQTVVMVERTEKVGKIEATNLGLKLTKTTTYLQKTRKITDVNAQTVSKNLGAIKGTLVNSNINGDDELGNIIIANAIQTSQEKQSKGESND